MDRYQRVEKPREEAPIKENEIRITTQGRMRNYITYATALLQRRIVGLHQNTTTGSTDITDMWEPLEEGLLPLETTRHVSMITITLSKKELDTSSMHTHLVAEGGAVVGEAVDEAGEGEEVDVGMDTMTMLMVVGVRMIMPLSIWATGIPVEEGEVSGAVAGEAAMVASLITSRMEAIMTRHLFLLQPEVVVVAGVGEVHPEAEDAVAM
nr:unnamed protein product [Digitaria exilis]